MPVENFDNSYLCWECTGSGQNSSGGPCKVCSATGIDPAFKGTPEPEVIEEPIKHKACKICGAPFMARTYKIYRRINGVLKWFIYKSMVCPECKASLQHLK